jgi:hypothetical protein
MRVKPTPAGGRSALKTELISTRCADLCAYADGKVDQQLHATFELAFAVDGPPAAAGCMALSRFAATLLASDPMAREAHFP